MQYEIIILELMTRIKKLEEEVAAIKERIDGDKDVDIGVSAVIIDPQRTQNSYQKMTDEMIISCYICGKKLNEGEVVTELADIIVDETGMNRNSAIMYIYAVTSLLSGTVFKRAISCKALKKYYDLIFNEYGSVGLQKAVHATRLHIEYRKECGISSDAIEELCIEYQNKL